ncbi:MAG TPA: Crp/Fnr family transcriptional regulator [Chitinophagaceae bacterium]|jgi:CRP/FNR family transcriptional regulator|nr:Crp/Fnr family transcriptional regulator [Chitinophagaceae bacterium]
MKKYNDCDLKSCFLCRNSLASWLPAIEGHKRNFIMRKGEAIFHEGDGVKGIYFLYKGTVKVHKRWGSEKELILSFAKPGDIIGYRGLGNEKVYPVTATAIEPVTVCFIDLSFFETTLEVNPRLTLSLMKFYANELQEAERRMRNLAHMEVKGRLAETLLHLRNRFGLAKEGYIDILLTRQDIASFTGTTYETIFRVMNEMSEEKLIRVQGKKIFLLKEAKLEKLLDVKNLPQARKEGPQKKK